MTFQSQFSRLPRAQAQENTKEKSDNKDMRCDIALWICDVEDATDDWICDVEDATDDIRMRIKKNIRIINES